MSKIIKILNTIPSNTAKNLSFGTGDAKLSSTQKSVPFAAKRKHPLEESFLSDPSPKNQNFNVRNLSLFILFVWILLFIVFKIWEGGRSTKDIAFGLLEQINQQNARIELLEDSLEEHSAQLQKFYILENNLEILTRDAKKAKEDLENSNSKQVVLKIKISNLEKSHQKLLQQVKTLKTVQDKLIVPAQ